MTEITVRDTANPDAEEMVLYMGPHHPSTHGVLNFMVETDGEVMSRCVPQVGYLHRGIEKIGEATPYPGFIPYTDRIDYLAAMFCNQGYAMTVEKLLDIEVPQRAEYLRGISGELNRIANHLLTLGVFAMDIGAITPFPYTLRERETINDLLEELCGARLTYNYSRIGGVTHDLPAGWGDKVLEFLDHFDLILEEFNRLITGNEIFIRRCADVAVITTEDAIAYGLAGPNLRSSGVDFDVRRDIPYSAYPEFDFEIPLGEGIEGTVGDCYDRFVVRIEEMRQSGSLVRQALASLPEGEIVGELPRRLRPDAADVYIRVESVRGEMGFYVVSDGSDTPTRVRTKTGSFTAMGIIEKLSPGLMIADLVALIASLDVVAPEVDR